MVCQKSCYPVPPPHLSAKYIFDRLSFKFGRKVSLFSELMPIFISFMFQNLSAKRLFMII